MDSDELSIRKIQALLAAKEKEALELKIEQQKREIEAENLRTILAKRSQRAGESTGTKGDAKETEEIDAEDEEPRKLDGQASHSKRKRDEQKLKSSSSGESSCEETQGYSSDDDYEKNSDEKAPRSNTVPAELGGISEYEELRLSNIAQNARYLESLGLENIKKEMRARNSSRGTTKLDTPSRKPRDHSDACSPVRASQRRKCAPQSYSESDGHLDALLKSSRLPTPKEVGRAKARDDLRKDFFPVVACHQLYRQSDTKAATVLNRHRFEGPVDLLSFDRIFEALESINVPTTEHRSNVRRDVEDEVRSMTTGAVPSRTTGGIQLSIACKQRPRLTRLLACFCRAHNPTARFNAITINKDYASALHIDKYNLGPSLIVSLGPYESGGELWTHDLGAVDARNRFRQFDGNIPHCTIPFTGRRYSLIFYSNRFHAQMSEFDCKYLAEELGFPLPPKNFVSPTKRPNFHISVEERILAAREAYELFSNSKGGSSSLLAESRADSLPSKSRVVAGTVMGIEIGKSKLVKCFNDDERLHGQSWHGSFVGTIKYYEPSTSFFGVLFC